MSPKIALVLGGGGSRGIAHIGVLEVLAQEQIDLDLIVGTSMGAIIGGMFALGLTPETLVTHLGAWQGNSVWTMNLFSARARQRQIAKQLADVFGNKTFADLRVPMVMLAVDLVTGKEVVLDSGPLLPAVLASSAVPVVFPPVEIDGMRLVDGGVIDSLNTQVAFAYGAEKVIAVDIYPMLEQDSWDDPLGAIMGIDLPFVSVTGDNPVSALWRSFRIAMWHLHARRISQHPPDVLLRPDVGKYGSLDFNDVAGPLEAGRVEALEHLNAIRALVTPDFSSHQMPPAGTGQ
jgi:NTE family protein